MAITYGIDKDHGLVRRIMSGVVTVQELSAYIHALSSEQAFSPACNELCDLRGVEGMKMNYSDMQAVIAECPFNKGSCRAFVAENDFGYGMSQMFRGIAAGEHGTIEVFRHLHEAEQWLDSGKC